MESEILTMAENRLAMMEKSTVEKLKREVEKYSVPGHLITASDKIAYVSDWRQRNCAKINESMVYHINMRRDAMDVANDREKQSIWIGMLELQSETGPFCQLALDVNWRHKQQLEEYIRQI